MARPPERSFRLVLESHDGRAPGADSEEKHEPVSDIDTVVVDSLKALDPEWPIREEADIERHNWHVRFVPLADICSAANRERRCPLPTHTQPNKLRRTAVLPLSNVIASSSFSVGCLSVDCAPSFRVQSVVVMVGFAFIIAFQIA